MPQNYLTDIAKSILFLLGLLILSALAFFILAANVSANNTTFYDQSIPAQMQTLASPAITTMVLLITWFGSAVAMLTLVPALSAMLLYFKRTRDFIFLIVATTGSAILTELAKAYFHRARPPMAMVIEPGYSFPSGHTALSTCLYGAAIVIIWRQNWPLWLRLLLSTLLSLLVILIGLSRIYLHVHYPTDVLAGLLLGIFWLCTCLIAYKTRL